MFDRPHAVATDETAEEAALYCLGDFSAQERADYEQHLAICDVCRGEVNAYSAAVAELALEEPVPPLRVRAAFLERIKRRVTPKPLATAEEVIITPELLQRPSERRDIDQMVEAIAALSKSLSGNEQDLYDALVAAALQVCPTGTAGFSLLYQDEQVFRWDALAGALAEAKGGTTPRDWSPCGTTLDLGRPQLFSHPSRYFQYFSSAAREIVEGLVVPVYVEEKAIGTLWVASHDDHQFDRGDLEVLQTFADYCGAAVGIIRRRKARAGMAGT